MNTALLIVLGVLLLILVLWLVGTANRLDRLHIRADAGWAALDAALARRAVVARTVAVSLDQATGDTVRSVAQRAEISARRDREAVENELSRLLAAVPRGELPHVLAAELVDAEQRVVIARRVHTDAIRDVLVQRRRRFVRWLKLAGTAPQPEYFEIAEPDLNGEVVPLPRPSARVLLVDDDGRVLMFRGRDVAHGGDGPYWFTVGGGVEPGEDLRTAALREVCEETGFEVPDDQLIGPVWRRRVVFSFDGRSYDAEEWYFLVTLTGGTREPDTSGFTAIELDTIDRHHWWTADELRDTDEIIYPLQLADLLPDLLATPWPGTTRTVR